jgi:hypothetical protein
MLLLTHIGYNRFFLSHQYSGEGRGVYAEKETCYIQYRQLLLFQRQEDLLQAYIKDVTVNSVL